jgi:hypothetical protein
MTKSSSAYFTTTYSGSINQNVLLQPGQTTHDQDHNGIAHVINNLDNLLSNSASLSNKSYGLTNATGSGGSFVFSNSPSITNPKFVSGASVNGSPVLTTSSITQKNYLTASGTASMTNSNINAPSIVSPSIKGPIYFSSASNLPFNNASLPAETIYFSSNSGSVSVTPSSTKMFNAGSINVIPGTTYEFEIISNIATGSIGSVSNVPQYVNSSMPLWFNTDFGAVSTNGGAQGTLLGFATDYSQSTGSIGNPVQTSIGTSSAGNWFVMASLYTMLNIGPQSNTYDINGVNLWSKGVTASMRYVSACGYANASWNNGQPSFPKPIKIVYYTKGGCFPESSTSGSFAWNGISWPGLTKADPSWFLYCEPASYNSSSNPSDSNNTGQAFGPVYGYPFSGTQSGGNEIVYSPGNYGSAVIFYDKNGSYVGTSGSYTDIAGNTILSGQGSAVAYAIATVNYNGASYAPGASILIGIKDWLIANALSGLKKWLTDSTGKTGASANAPLVINSASYWDIADGIEMDSMGLAGYVSSTSWQGFGSGSLVGTGPYPYMSSTILTKTQFLQTRADQIAVVKNASVGIVNAPSVLTVFVNGMETVAAIASSPSPSVMWAGGADYYMPENAWHGAASGYNSYTDFADNGSYTIANLVSLTSSSTTIPQSNKMWQGASANFNDNWRLPWSEFILCSALLTASVDPINSIGNNAVFKGNLASNYTEVAQGSTPPLYDLKTSVNLTNINNQNSAINVIASGDMSEYPGILRMYLANIGSPSGVYASAANYVSRTFTNGLVIINNSNSTFTYNFPGTASYFRPSTSVVYSGSINFTSSSPAVLLVNYPSVTYTTTSAGSIALNLAGNYSASGTSFIANVAESASGSLTIENNYYSNSGSLQIPIGSLPSSGGNILLYVKGTANFSSSGKFSPQLIVSGASPTVLPGAIIKLTEIV